VLLGEKTSLEVVSSQEQVEVSLQEVVSSQVEVEVMPLV